MNVQLKFKRKNFLAAAVFKTQGIKNTDVMCTVCVYELSPSRHTTMLDWCRTHITHSFAHNTRTCVTIHTNDNKLIVLLELQGKKGEIACTHIFHVPAIDNVFSLVPSLCVEFVMFFFSFQMLRTIPLIPECDIHPIVVRQ